MRMSARQRFQLIHLIYRNHYDLHTWALLDVKDFQAAFRMTLMYLELDHEQALELDEFNSNCKK